MKKIISIILCLALLIPCGVIHAYAQNSSGLKITTTVPQMTFSLPEGGEDFKIYLGEEEVDGTTISVNRFEALALRFVPAEGKSVNMSSLNGMPVETENGTDFIITLSENIDTISFEAVDIPDTVKDVKYNASLTLNDSIDINFSMSGFTEDFDASKLLIIVDGKAIKASDINASATKVSCVLGSVSPEEMSKAFNVEVRYDGNTVKVFPYAILNYCKAVFKAYTSNNAKYEKLNNLCVALLNYGACSENYYYEACGRPGYESTLAQGCGIDFGDNYTIPEPDIEYGMKTTGAYVTKSAALLEVGSKISLVYKILTTGIYEAITKDDVLILNNYDEKVDKDNITFTKLTDDTYEYETVITGIGASKLSRTYTLTLSNMQRITQNHFSMTYGVYNYCYDIATYTGTNPAITDNLKKLCKAIYNYGEAARLYSESLNPTD